MRYTLALALIASACGGTAARPVAVSERPRLPEYFDPSPSGHLLEEVTQVSAGALHTCALRAEGSVYCWGANAVGQLGDGTRDDSRAPVRVRDLPPARSIAAGEDYTCASTDRGIYCWGANAVGQLGNGESANGYSRPVPVLASGQPAASALSERTCAIGDRLACWGQLPVFDAGGRPIFGEDRADVRASAIAIGEQHECAIAEGRVLCRGVGPNGELGNGSNAPAYGLTPVEGIERAVSIAAGHHHTCAALADGTLWCWGDNTRGQLGLRGSSGSSIPVRVDLPIAVRTVVAGAEHTCALGENGDVRCFGDNRDRQSGADGEMAAPREVRLGGRAIAIAAGARHTCVVLDDRQVRCWGDNDGGQLGDGTLGDDRAWPIAVLDGDELGEFEPELGELAMLEIE